MLVLEIVLVHILLALGLGLVSGLDLVFK